MMFMTAKVDMKKIVLILGAIAAVIVALILLFGLVIFNKVEKNFIDTV